MKREKDGSIFSWSLWVEFCRHYDIDPFECADLSIGYQNSPDCFTIEYKGDYPKREEGD